MDMSKFGNMLQIVTLFVIIAATVGVGLIVLDSLTYATLTSLTVTNESFTGNSSAYVALANANISSVSNVNFNNITTSSNTTTVNTNTSNQSVVLPTLNTPLVTTGTANLTLTFNNDSTTTLVNVSIAGTRWGQINGLNASPQTISVNQSALTSSITVTFIANATGINITNTTLSYRYFNDYTNYTMNLTPGRILTGANGSFRISYTYGNVTTSASNATSTVITAMNNFASNFGTAGTLAGIMAIVLIAIGVLTHFGIVGGRKD